MIYQALTIYLLIAIGWHGGEELSALDPKVLGSVVGFMAVGFITNFFIGILAYLGLSALTRMRRIDKATVAGYYGSDSAGTFVTCLGVLGTVHILYDAYMPVMLAVMEIPGCLVALYLVSRLRHQGMDPRGNMPDEPGYDPTARPDRDSPLVTGDGDGNRSAAVEAGRRKCPWRRWSTNASTGEAVSRRVPERSTAPRGLPQPRTLPALRRHYRRLHQRAARQGSDRTPTTVSS